MEREASLISKHLKCDDKQTIRQTVQSAALRTTLVMMQRKSQRYMQQNEEHKRQAGGDPCGWTATVDPKNPNHVRVAWLVSPAFESPLTNNSFGVLLYDSLADPKKSVIVWVPVSACEIPLADLRQGLFRDGEPYPV